jgi:MFS family permease
MPLPAPVIRMVRAFMTRKYTARLTSPVTKPQAAASAAAPAPSPWSALRYPVFRWLWIATVVSNVGGWMYSAASGWLMTSLSADPLIVSLVQVATTLPLFLFGLPAGALADMVDRRRLILALEILTSIFSAVFALLIALQYVNPQLLLFFTFLLGTLSALETPAWQAIVPQLVPKPALASAVAVNSLGVNISRVIGPALAGVLILSAGIAMPFWLDAVSNAGVIAVILWWRPAARPAHALPAERLLSAIRIGVRYARYDRQLRATLIRAAGFFLFASAYWALLPVLARTQLHGGPTLYGVLLGTIGAGSIAGAFAMPRIHRRLGPDGLVVCGGLATALAMMLFGLARTAPLAVLACLVAGFGWICALATLNVSAQAALPEWVRGRGLAIYVTVFFGTLSVGSLLWGFVANRLGLPPALLIAAAGALVMVPLTQRWKLRSGPAADLTPSMHWPEPVRAESIENDAGPVLVTLRYQVAARNRAAFLKAVRPLERQRRRGGAYAWAIFEDAAQADVFLEIFLADSWLEHLRQHEHVTQADRAVQDRVISLAEAPPHVTHLVAAQLPEGR